jgi:hypothetical protein
VVGVILPGRVEETLELSVLELDPAWLVEVWKDDDVEDDGVEEDGVEDDGVEDDGVEDDGVEDDVVEDDVVGDDVVAAWVLVLVDDPGTEDRDCEEPETGSTEEVEVGGEEEVEGLLTEVDTGGDVIELELEGGVGVEELLLVVGGGGAWPVDVDEPATTGLVVAFPRRASSIKVVAIAASSW